MVGDKLEVAAPRRTVTVPGSSAADAGDLRVTYVVDTGVVLVPAEAAEVDFTQYMVWDLRWGVPESGAVQVVLRPRPTYAEGGPKRVARARAGV